MKYMLICNNCGQKHFTNGNDISNLTEVKTAPLPRHADGVNKEIQEVTRKFRCSHCGMLLKVVKLEKKEETKEEIKQEEIIFNDEDHLKNWENEILKSIRKKSNQP